VFEKKEPACHKVLKAGALLRNDHLSRRSGAMFWGWRMQRTAIKVCRLAGGCWKRHLRKVDERIGRRKREVKKLEKMNELPGQKPPQ